ncbi:BtrH N-terminal domain-containing protein [Salinibaculum salinum]|uniref:BtrH N-terminal domain-containing protein n=1 Tax=Salinibaculum salinum TaxID=3131996 RepID=UPI0030EB7C69
MELVEGYDHQPGSHCGAIALRNVAQYYGWNYSEATCFGIGGGPAFVLYDHPEEPWVTFRASSTWLERAFFERLGVPHSFRSGDDFQTAWDNATMRVDEDDPVFVFLDPTPLPYLPDEPDHVPPHVAVMIGYDEETVILSDGAMEARQEVSRATLQSAWASDGIIPLDNEYLTVTRARTTNDGTDAAAAGLRQTATYMLEPLQIKRDARGPGAEGLAALRSFGDYLGAWPDLPEPDQPVAAAHRSIDEHGEGAAFRALYADSIEELGQRTELPHDLSDRMARVGEQWQTVADHLENILTADDPHPARFEEAASLIGEIADREEAIFEAIAEELGQPNSDE